jgi:prepilin-type N-terminal cleavage/methylation domain-containing protein
MRPGRGGFTLIELLLASLVSAVIASGTMMAFVTAARMVRDQNIPSNAEASGFAEETLERFRNLVAYGTSGGLDPVFATWITNNAGPSWHADPLPGSGGTNSILSFPHRRCVRVTPRDCDGVGGTGDCYGVDARVCWKTLTNCPC